MRVWIACHSAFSSSVFASAMCVSQIPAMSPLFSASSNFSVVEPISESTENLEIWTCEARCWASFLLNVTSLPPYPNETPTGLSNQRGAFAREKAAPWGCVCAFVKKSSPSRLLCAEGALEGFVFCKVWMVIFPSKEAVADRFGFSG